jgi:hypothetical protein
MSFLVSFLSVLVSISLMALSTLIALFLEPGRFVARASPLFRTPLLGLALAFAGFLGLWWPAHVADATHTVPTLIRVPLLVFFAGAYFCFGVEHNSLPPDFEGVHRAIEGHWLDRWFSKRLAKPIDAIFIFMLRKSSIVWPPLALLIASRGLEPAAILLFLGAQTATAGMVEGIDHIDIHNNVFQPREGLPWFSRVAVRLAGIYHTYVLCQAEVRLPHYYRIQHVWIHHAENNSENDNQSTLHSDPTSFVDFSRTGVRFALSSIAPVDVFLRLGDNKKRTQQKQLIWGLAVYYGTLFAIGLFAPLVALLLFFYRFMMFVTESTQGLFTWHSLVDSSAPKNSFRNSLNFSYPEAERFHQNLGSSLHVEHHHRPGRHWSQLALDAIANRSEYEKHDVIVLQEGKSDRLLPYLWLRDFEGMAAMLSPIGAGRHDPETRADLLRSRARLDQGRSPGSASHRFDRVLSQTMGRIRMAFVSNKESHSAP